MYINPIKLAAAVMLAAAAVPSQAAVTLSFDDIPDRGTPGQFYNGGRAIDQFGQQSGNPGPAFGISIQGFATVLEQLRLCPGGIPCGSTVIPKPPSGLKVLSAPFERNDFNRTLFNLARGFTDEISFWIYVPGGALAAPASVTIFANEGGYTASANPILGFVSVPAPTNCVFATSPITTVSGCGFTKFTMAFSGAARSVLFQGAVFDDITIGAPGGGAVPEPASWAMLIAGFGLTGAAMRRRRAALTV